MQLCEILAGVIETDITLDISDLSQHSRTIQKGDAFIAVQGGSTHGNEFIADALHRGASVIITSKSINAEVPVVVVEDLENKLDMLARNAYPEAQKRTIIAVTGTNGKTSITSFLTQVLQGLDKKVLSIGTLTHTLTTPDIFTLYRELHYFKGDYAVLEVSSHALMQGRVKGLSFAVVVWSNLTQDHLDYHQTMQQYLQAKLRICQQANYGIFNADDEYYPQFADALNHESYSLSDIDFSLKEFGFLCTLEHIVFELPLLGEFNISNMLAAYKTLRYLGYGSLDILRLISNISPPVGRMQQIAQSNIFIDFAHTPDGLQHALMTLTAHKHKDITLVFGCGGNRDKAKRALMGKVANKFATRIILTNDNPRNEEPEAITTDIAGGITKEYEVILDRKLAIISALEDGGNIVLIAGKGHENYQIIGDTYYTFNDAQVVQSLL